MRIGRGQKISNDKCLTRPTGPHVIQLAYTKTAQIWLIAVLILYHFFVHIVDSIVEDDCSGESPTTFLPILPRLGLNSKTIITRKSQVLRRAINGKQPGYATKKQLVSKAAQYMNEWHYQLSLDIDHGYDLEMNNSGSDIALLGLLVVRL